MLSASRSLMSTNCPERTLFTNFWGKGSEAGDRLNPDVAVGAAIWPAFGRELGAVVRVLPIPSAPDIGITEGNVPSIVFGLRLSPGVLERSGTEASAVGGGMTPRGGRPDGSSIKRTT